MSPSDGNDARLTKPVALAVGTPAARSKGLAGGVVCGEYGKTIELPRDTLGGVKTTRYS